MNIYKVNQYYIAAKNPEDAFGEFMEYTNAMENVFIGELEENEKDTISITVKRLSNKAIKIKSTTCHSNEDLYSNCTICADNDDVVYLSLQELVDEYKETDFPKVLCWEM